MENENNEITPETLEVSNDQIEKMWQDAKASMQGHSWIQRGTEIICESCPFKHGFYVEPEKRLVGIDENGNPIIDKIF
jgi:cytochrome c1